MSTKKRNMKSGRRNKTAAGTRSSIHNSKSITDRRAYGDFWKDLQEVLRCTNGHISKLDNQMPEAVIRESIDICSQNSYEKHKYNLEQDHEITHEEIIELQRADPQLELQERKRVRRMTHLTRTSDFVATRVKKKELGCQWNTRRNKNITKIGFKEMRDGFDNRKIKEQVKSGEGETLLLIKMKQNQEELRTPGYSPMMKEMG
jgi:hypothetical protein